MQITSALPDKSKDTHMLGSPHSEILQYLSAICLAHLFSIPGVQLAQ